MRRFFCILLLGAAVLLPVQARGEAYIRILAQDDSLAAQREKILFRDVLLSRCAGEEALFAALAEMEAAGLLEWEIRPWAPAGHPLRPAVYIALGEGRGRNWWGVLFPDALKMAQLGEAGGEGVTLCYPIFTFLFGWLWGK